MAVGPDRVQVIKRESAALGGDGADDADYLQPLTPQEDALECAGVYLQDAVARDENVFLARDNGRIVAKDTVLSVVSPLVTEDQHGKLRQLVHLADGVGGPMEGWASGSYRETLPSASPFPTSIIWWTDSGKTMKIVQKLITFDSQKRVTSVQWSAFASDGTTVIAQVTDAISYSSVFETSRTRTVT